MLCKFILTYMAEFGRRVWLKTTSFKVSGLAKSNKMAREFIANNAVSVNGNKCNDLEMVLTSSAGLHGQYHVIKRGKKLFHLLHWVE